MKKFIFSSLVGLALVAFTGCTNSNEPTVSKCNAGKCNGNKKVAKKCQASSKCGGDKKVVKKCGDGKCGSK